MAMMCRSFLFLVLISIFGSLCCAEIRYREIRSDVRPIIPFDEFRFTHYGRLELRVSEITLPNQNRHLDLDKLGFFLCTLDAWIHVIKQLSDGDITCALESDLVKAVYDFRSLKGESKFDTLFLVNKPDRYTLLFANCLDQVNVSMTVRSAMFNLDGEEDYLSADETILPTVYFTLSIVYFTLTGIWIYIICRRRITVSRIHFLMLTLLVLKSLNFIFETGNKSYIKRTGIVDDCWKIPLHILSFLKGIMFFTMLVSIGSPLKHYVQHKVSMVSMIVIPLQIVANLAQVLDDEAPPFSPSKATWEITVILIDVICYCALLLPIVWRIKNLGEAEADEKAAAYLMKLKLLRHYYIVVICYVYLSRVAISVWLAMTSFEYLWSGVLVWELANVAFYVYTASKFTPEEHRPYFVIDDEEKDIAAKLLKVEDGEENNRE